MAEEFLSPIDMLLDENNKDNIVLYDDKNKEVEFLNDNLKEESVPVMVDNVLNAITDMRKQHRQARTMIDTYWSSNREIDKLLLNNEHFMK